MENNDLGRIGDADRAGRASPEPASSLGHSATIPCAVTIPGEVYAFLMGEGPLEGVWFGDLNEGLPGRFWWRGLLRCAAGWPASGTEAQSGGTACGSDPKDDGPARDSGDAQPQSP